MKSKQTQMKEREREFFFSICQKHETMYSCYLSSWHTGASLADSSRRSRKEEASQKQ